MDWIALETRDGSTVFLPGEEIEGTVSWQLASPGTVELRLLWYTEGKGDQDSRLVATLPFPNPGGSEVRPFRVRLPAGPFSFSGRLLSLLWTLEAVAAPGPGPQRLAITVSPTRQEIRLGRASAG
jgi:hypothetical protein